MESRKAFLSASLTLGVKALREGRVAALRSKAWNLKILGKHEDARPASLSEFTLQAELTTPLAAGRYLTLVPLGPWADGTVLM